MGDPNDGYVRRSGAPYRSTVGNPHAVFVRPVKLQGGSAFYWQLEDVTRFVDGGAKDTAIALPAIRDDLVV